MAVYRDKWMCPKCGKYRTTFRRTASIGKSVSSYCTGCGKVSQVIAGDPAKASATPHNTGMDAIAEMDKAVLCLAIQVPESVYDDVKRKWDAVVAQQRHA